MRESQEAFRADKLAAKSARAPSEHSEGEIKPIINKGFKEDVVNDSIVDELQHGDLLKDVKSTMMMKDASA